MYWRYLVFSLTVATFLAPAPGRAAIEVGGESRIIAATIFPDRAEVLRVVEVSVPAGHSTLVIENLPANLIAESVRVRGSADGALTIGSVETKRRFEVAVVRGSTKVSERDVGQRKGVLAWRGSYEPGETRTIKFGYAVTYPDGQAVPGF